MNEVALAPSRLPIQPAIAKEYDLSPAVWRVLVEQIFPSARTVEAVLMALAYCRERKLDILKRPVHIVPMWSAAKRMMVETVWPGIAEIRTTASRTGQYAGIDAVEFGPMVEETFTGNTGKENVTKTVRYPEWASVIVYRMINGQRCPFNTRVFWDESYATMGKSGVPNEMWARRPRGQLDKCVEAAALRKAFPEELGAVYAAEEMEGRTIDHDEIVEPDRPTPPKPPVKSLSQPIQPSPMPPMPPMPPVKAIIEEKTERVSPPTPLNTPTPPKPPRAPRKTMVYGDQAAPEPEPTPEPEQPAIYDAETGEIIDVDISDVDMTPAELLASLSEMLETAKDDVEIEEIWDGHDVEARLESEENGAKFLTLAFGLKQKNLTRVGG